MHIASQHNGIPHRATLPINTPVDEVTTLTQSLPKWWTINFSAQGSWHLVVLLPPLTWLSVTWRFMKIHNVLNKKLPTLMSRLFNEFCWPYTESQRPASNFLLEYWFLIIKQKQFNIVSLPWKLDNPCYHTVHNVSACGFDPRNSSSMTTIFTKARYTVIHNQQTDLEINCTDTWT